MEISEEDKPPAAGENLTAEIRMDPPASGGSYHAAAAIGAALGAKTTKKPVAKRSKKAASEAERIWGGLRTSFPTRPIPFTGSARINYPSMRNRSSQCRRQLANQQDCPKWWLDLFFNFDVMTRIVNETNHYVARTQSFPTSITFGKASLWVVQINCGYK